MLLCVTSKIKQILPEGNACSYASYVALQKAAGAHHNQYCYFTMKGVLSNKHLFCKLSILDPVIQELVKITLLGMMNDYIVFVTSCSFSCCVGSQLPPTVTWQLIREKFSECGDVKFAEMTASDTAVVRFHKEWDAERAISILQNYCIINFLKRSKTCVLKGM